jgi:hypothetical protein
VRFPIRNQIFEGFERRRFFSLIMSGLCLKPKVLKKAACIPDVYPVRWLELTPGVANWVETR